ncbi:MAG TPA: VTT domain-containing protein [Gammaproteobacteria bacterium]|nr:VTT domain-containing protein [Gammaproteobacteria bacterium]
MFDPNAWPHDVSTYGYLAVFFLSLLEGPIVTVYAALLAAQGLLSLPLVYLTVVVGDLAGDLLFYAVGRYGLGHRFWPRRVRERCFLRRLAVLRGKLRAHTGAALLFGKLTQAFGFGILLAAGAARVRMSLFLLYNLLGTLPKSAALMAVGYFFGRYYETLSHSFQWLGFAGFSLGLLLTLYLLHRLSVTQASRVHGWP